MSATVTCVDRLTVEPVDIELPEACPECGQDFSEPSSLVEIGYMATRRTCQLVSANGVTVVSDHETAEVTDELAYATGYSCGGCQKVLALEAPRHRVVDPDEEVSPSD
jgi:hypothetical protein